MCVLREQLRLPERLKRFASSKGAAIRFWAVAAVLVLLCVAIEPLTVRSYDPLAGRRDFLAFYVASKMVVSGHSSELYNFPAQANVQPNVAVSRRVYYIRPPYEAAAMAPLGYLEYSSALKAWNLLQLAFAILSSWLICRGFPQIGSFGPLILTAVVFSYGSIVNFIHGQDSFLVLATLIGAGLALRSEQHLLAGALLAFSSVKPQVVFYVICSLVALKCWRTIGAMAISILALFLACTAGLHLPGAYSYSSALLEFSKKPEMPHLMPSLRGLLWLMDAPDHQALYLLVAANVVALGALVWLIRRRYLSAITALALSVGLSIILSPHSHNHDMVFMAFPLVIAFARTNRLQFAVSGAALIWYCFQFIEERAPLASLPTGSLLAVIGWAEYKAQRASLIFSSEQRSSVDF